MGLQVAARQMADSEGRVFPAPGLSRELLVPGKLVADRRADEVRPVGEGALLDQKVDRAEVDIAKVNGDLLAITDRSHCRLHAPSSWMVQRWCHGSRSLRDRLKSMLGRSL